MALFCSQCGQKLAEDARFCLLLPLGLHPPLCTTPSTKPIVATPKHRELLYEAYWEVMLKGLDEGEITVEESKEFSQVMVDRLDEVNTPAKRII